MFLSSRFTLLAAVAAAVGLGLAPVTNANAGLVFEADFSGTGTGTGTGNIVQSGGTATLGSTGNATASIVTGTNLAGGPGGYLQVVETAGTGGYGTGATVTPTSGFQSWWSPTGSGTGGADNTVNGSFDFFYENSNAGGQWATGPFSDASGPNNAFGINANNNSTGAGNTTGYQYYLYGGDGITSAGYSMNVTAYNLSLAANTLYHIAGVVSTNTSTGLVTGSLYVVSGNTAIIPGTTTPVATTTSAQVFDATSNAPLQFLLGDAWFTNSNTVAQTEKLDQFRIYSGTPTTFSALPTTIPEPTTLGLMALGGLALLLPRRKRA